MSTAAAKLSPKLNTQLSVMMFLQYGIWGAWLPLFYSFLTEHHHLGHSEVGWLFAISASGALLGPFISGQIADRYFNTEKFLGISHIVGAVLVWQLSSISTYAGLLGFGFVYSVIFAPTLALTNSLAFHHLPDRDRDFGRVRVWGTVGWIIVGIGIGQWLLHHHTPTEAAQTSAAQAAIVAMKPEDKAKALTAASAKLKAEASSAEREEALLKSEKKKAERQAHVGGMADSFRLSAILGVLLGLYCFVLPKTPPKKGEQKFAPAQALGEVKKMPLLALFLIAFPVSCVHQFYFVHTAGFLGNMNHPLADKINVIFGVGGGGLMTVGQIFEIVILAFMPMLAKKMSRKNLLALGLAAYILRFAVFGFISSPLLIIPALALHGFCFGCFFFVAFMIIDEETATDVRASAQNLFNFVIVGLGIIVGNIFSGYVGQMATTADGSTSYPLLFGIPMGVSIACLLALLAVYPSRKAGTAAQPSAASEVA
jgi:MFS family permease